MAILRKVRGNDGTGSAMKARVLDGKALAAECRSWIRTEVQRRAANGAPPPGLAVVLVGNDTASEIYVNAKRRDCEEVGFHSLVERAPATVSQEELEALVAALNAARDINGILVQLPLPKHIDANRITDRIDPAKDVDGFHPYNIGRLALRRPALPPCTSKGVMLLLDSTGVDYLGARATVIGASNHVGRPMALELLRVGCTVEVAHKFTRDTAACAKKSDILISAVGKPKLVDGDWIKPGAVVIDVGITRDAQGRLHGDVDFEAAAEAAAWITPVPGGVGPMTRAALMLNTLQAAGHGG